MVMMNTGITQDIMREVRDCIDKANELLNSQNFNSQNLNELVSIYEKLYSLTSDIKYKKDIANILYFYFNQKGKSLTLYLEYISQVKNDQTVYYIIANLYKGLKDTLNYKKYLDLAVQSTRDQVQRVVPNSDDLILGVNIGVAAGLSMNDNVDGITTYKQIMEFAPSNTNIMDDYIKSEKDKAKEYFKNKCWQEAMLKYKDIFNNTVLKEDEFVNLIICLKELNQKGLALEYLSKYEEVAEDKDRANYVVADLLYFKFDMKEEAIARFERYIQKNPNDALVCNTLGHLYAECYGDNFVDKQLKYFLKAVELNPNSKVFLKNVSLTYSKLNDFENTDKYYRRLLNVNPSNNDYFDYGCFLIKNGKLDEGYTYLLHRFDKEDNPALYPPMLPPEKLLTSSVDLSDKIVLVQCEQGYGDSIMYSRYVKELTKIAKKVLFVVQDELIDLFKSSNLGAEMYGYSVDFSKLEYDYHIPIISLPVLFDISPENIPYAEGYLTPNNKDIDLYDYEFINHSGNIKIGIAFEGSDLSTDLNRDIPLKELLPIIEMEKVDIYSLQHYDKDKQLENLPKNNIINLGKDFSTFEETAAAIKNMDLIITTDNVILNLAGALGVTTFGIFNKHNEYRWFDLSGDDVVWYKSVKPFVAKQVDDWASVVKEIKSQIN